MPTWRSALHSLMHRFSFWGLFAAFGVILLAYWLWMRRLERREDGNRSRKR